MRLIRVCIPLIFAVVLGAAMLAAQQAQSPTTHSPAQTNGAKESRQTHRAAHKRNAKARKSAKRPEYRPEYKENSVEVINGDAKKKVVFHDELGASAQAKNLPASLKETPQPMKVEVLNGASTDTQYFYGGGQEQAAAHNQTVVIGIQSSETRVAGGNKHPVVTGITAEGTGDAKSSSSGGQPVTKGVSPRPNRPVYQPDQH